MNISRISFNRLFSLKDLWGLRRLFFVLFLRFFTPSVFINLSRVFFSNFFKNARVHHKPFYAMIETTSRCNLRCKMCKRTLYPFNRVECDMPYERFKEIIDQIGDCLFFVALWNYGEPLLNPETSKMVEYCSQKGIITVLSTNAMLLDPERSSRLIAAGLKYLIICVDGATDDVYGEYRGGAKFSELEHRVKKFCVLKKEKKAFFPIVELQFIVMKGNEHQVDAFFHLARAWGVDRASLKKFSALRHSADADPFLPSKEAHRLDCYKKGALCRKDFCLVPWQGVVINADGGLVPCCLDYFSAHIMGNAFFEKIDQIWNNDKYIEFRRQIKRDINTINVCRACPHTSGHAGSFISVRQIL